MPTNTTKFNLVKPLKGEKYNVDVFNGNADIIDTQIYSKTEVDTALNGKANTVHNHVKADITDFAHTHPISEVTNLQTALNGKANTVHTHTKSQITDFAHNHAISEVVNLQTSLDGKANTTTTVNNKALSSNITINASDVPNTPAGNISATNVQNAINELDTEKANRVQEAWITPTLLNGFTHGSIPLQYRKIDVGLVHLRGQYTGGSTFASIFNLPAGYRPISSIREVIPSSYGTGYMNIEVDGTVTHAVGTTSNTHWVNIIFSTT